MEVSTIQRAAIPKKIKDVMKQYHSNKNYTFCGLMTDLGLTNEANL